MLNLHTVSRDNLFDAKAIYDNGKVTVLKGSKINTRKNPNFKLSDEVTNQSADTSLVKNDGFLKKDVELNSLSTSATSVVGRISNGMITWKTEDGKYVRYTLKGE